MLASAFMVRLDSVVERAVPLLKYVTVAGCIGTIVSELTAVPEVTRVVTVLTSLPFARSCNRAVQRPVRRKTRLRPAPRQTFGVNEFK